MEELTILLLQRIALLLLCAFLLTRIPSFRYLLDREINLRTVLSHSVIFGLFGIASTQAGVIFDGERFYSGLWYTGLAPDETLVSSGLVAVVIAGLLGGPAVGLGAGCITGGYTLTLGGHLIAASSLVNPITGFLAGLTARFFSQERVISPFKALFIGMFAPILYMHLFLIFSSRPEETIPFVNAAGVPLVVSNSVGIAIFTAVIRVALEEKEREAAGETRRAFKIAETALPHLRQGLNGRTARKLAELLNRELTNVAGVAVTDGKRVLAHAGKGAKGHGEGGILPREEESAEIGETGLKMVSGHERMDCGRPRCPLRAALLIPIFETGEKVGQIILYFQRQQQIRPVEIAFAQGLEKLLSHQLDMIAAEKAKALLQEAELRNLQAQVHPHFLFNTLHLIATLIRVDPAQARHLIVQLGAFLRSSMKLASSSLVPLEQEEQQLKAYLEIVRVRFRGKLDIRYRREEGIEQVPIPPFTLQPLVENSIQHGLKDTSGGGLVEIELARDRKDKRRLQVVIRDNGKGIPPHILAVLGKAPIPSPGGGRSGGMGIYNVNQRLIRLFGEEARLRFANRPKGGSIVSFQIPCPAPGERNRGEEVTAHAD